MIALSFPTQGFTVQRKFCPAAIHETEVPSQAFPDRLAQFGGFGEFRKGNEFPADINQVGITPFQNVFRYLGVDNATDGAYGNFTLFLIRPATPAYVPLGYQYGGAIYSGSSSWPPEMLASQI